MKIEKIDHICIAVHNLREAEQHFYELFEMQPDEHYVHEGEKMEAARYFMGDVVLELITPTSSEGEVAKFLRKRGEGFYLISFKVSDLKKTVKELKEKNIPLVDDVIHRKWRDSNFTFIKPSATFRVLIELMD